MLNAVSLLLVTMALSVVMLLVLWSLSRHNVAGIRDWSLANGLAVAALLLFSGRGLVPDFVSIEVANTLLMASAALMLVGFRRHLSRSLPVGALAAGGACTLAALVVFHYGVDTIAWRIVAASAFHAATCFAIGATVRRALPASGARYPFVFTAIAAFALAAGHVVRGLVYALQAVHLMEELDPALLNLVFFAIGTLALPVQTLGAVMMANAQIITRTAYAADHDHLTGALSRRAFFAMAEREHARTLRTHASLSLLVFDVDHFKRINDTHGHAAGDQVLVDIVLRTESVIRSVDACARLGGEEFAVLLPDTGAATALVVAERLRAALESTLALPAANASVAYTVSVGIATLQQDESVAAMLSRADKALYCAKSAGRNTAVCAAADPGSCAQDAIRTCGAGRS
jgi:diguanylate cyclase (GGDEF)-like protein